MALKEGKMKEHIRESVGCPDLLTDFPQSTIHAKKVLSALWDKPKGLNRFTHFLLEYYIREGTFYNIFMINLGPLISGSSTAGEWACLFTWQMTATQTSVTLQI